MTKYLLCLWVLVVGVSGCTSYSAPLPSASCVYPERDLTIPWAERTYWCLPQALQPVPRSLSVNEPDLYRGGR